MAIGIIVGVVLIMVTLFAMFRDQFLVVLGIALISLIILYIMRLIADAYWWGKDKGKWD